MKFDFEFDFQVLKSILWLLYETENQFKSTALIF